ncbi:MAG: glycosyl transferase family 2 [Candidatus Saccharibacteria bacterium]|nr:glycosyl transferase family 2 [Candidatus Saccharibacteria bacterium]
MVDNNSTDESAAIASLFPFVTVISQPRQGVVHARNAGFNAVTGDIIGRIDADTLVDPDWVATIQRLFRDQSLDAVSGAVSYHDLPWHRFLTRLDLSFRQWIADGMGNEVFLFGSNMAMRRCAWNTVKAQVCNAGGMHEDFDLAIHLYQKDQTVRFDRRLHAAVSLRRFNVPLGSYWRYVWMSPKTYSIHGRRSQGRMYPVVWLVVGAYFVIQLLYRTYNRASPRTLRVNPTTFVD